MNIYKITYILNSTKRYIGKTTKYNNNEEFQKSKYWGSGIYIKRAIKDYGKENFEREILVSGIETRKNLDLWEKVLIWGFGSRYPNGYNIGEGGEGGDNFTNNPNKEKIRRKLRRKKKDFYQTLEGKNARKKISETRIKMGLSKGSNHPLWGKPRPKEIKEKISESIKYFLSTPEGDKWRKKQSEQMKGRYMGDKNPAKKPKARKKISETRIKKGLSKGGKNPNARSVLLISPPPENKPYNLSYYKDFCLEYKLNCKCIRLVLQKKLKHYKGWTGRYLDKK